MVETSNRRRLCRPEETPVAIINLCSPERDAETPLPTDASTSCTRQLEKANETVVSIVPSFVVPEEMEISPATCTGGASPCLLLEDSQLEEELGGSPASRPTELTSPESRLENPIEMLMMGERIQGDSLTDEPVQPGSFAVPGSVRRRLAHLRPEKWSRRQRSNIRMKVQRPDGTFFRIRASKLKRLKECY